MKFDAEFKNAISQLSPKEKDKLLLRLLKKDLILANQLLFELVSNESVQERRAKMEMRIKKEITRLSDRFYSLGFLLMDVRALSGEITEHVKITKDKYGDASLNLLMLNELVAYIGHKIEQAALKDAYTLCIYIIARTFKVLILIKSLHEDFLVEFEDGLGQLGQLIVDNPKLMKISINNGLDINWLIKADIPNNIAEIHKHIRSQGFLK